MHSFVVAPFAAAPVHGRLGSSARAGARPSACTSTQLPRAGRPRVFERARVVFVAAATGSDESGAAVPDREVPFPLEREASRVLLNCVNLLVAKKLVNTMEAEEAAAFRDFFSRYSLRQEPKRFIQELFKEQPTAASSFIELQEEFVQTLELGMVPEMIMEGLERGKLGIMREYLKEATEEGRQTPLPEDKKDDKGGPGWLGRDKLFTKNPSK